MASGEVEGRLGLPMLGYLMKMEGADKKSLQVQELAFINDSRSLFAESIRTIGPAF